MSDLSPDPQSPAPSAVPVTLPPAWLPKRPIAFPAGVIAAVLALVLSATEVSGWAWTVVVPFAILALSLGALGMWLFRNGPTNRRLMAIGAITLGTFAIALAIIESRSDDGESRRPVVASA
jgi:hypothetical protein